MKEFNFNTIKNLPVLERWIENALAIPETEEQKPAVVPLSNVHCEESAEPMTRQSQPFWRKPRFIALAASLVLVTALSISLFLSMGSKPPISVKSDSKPDSTQIVWSTDEYGATVATEVVVVPKDGDQNGTAPTERDPRSSNSLKIFSGQMTAPLPLRRAVKTAHPLRMAERRSHPLPLRKVRPPRRAPSPLIPPPHRGRSKQTRRKSRRPLRLRNRRPQRRGSRSGMILQNLPERLISPLLSRGMYTREGIIMCFAVWKPMTVRSSAKVVCLTAIV